MTEEWRRDTHMLRIGNSHGCGSSITEGVNAHGFAELVFGAGSDAVIESHLRHGGSILGDPERILGITPPTAFTGEKIGSMDGEVVLKRFVQNAGQQGLKSAPIKRAIVRTDDLTSLLTR